MQADGAHFYPSAQNAAFVGKLQRGTLADDRDPFGERTADVHYDIPDRVFGGNFRSDDGGLCLQPGQEKEHDCMFCNGIF